MANSEAKKRANREWAARNKDKVASKNAAYRAANYQKILTANKARYHANKGKARGVRLMRAYGLTEADFDSMLSRQGNACAVCRAGTPRSRHGTWHVDHDHSTGKVRAILCHPCNTGIGLFSDDPALLEAAASYLRRHN